MAYVPDQLLILSYLACARITDHRLTHAKFKIIKDAYGSFVLYYPTLLPNR